MRGIQPDSRSCRDIRLAAGLTQAQLAARAGVSERTVRNVETGRRVRFEFLAYIGQALGVEMFHLVAATEELRQAKREEANGRRLWSAIEQFAIERDMQGFEAILHPSVRCIVHGPGILPFTGEHRGLDGLRNLMDISENAMTYLEPPKVSEIGASGNLVIMTGTDHIRANRTGKSSSSWWQHIYEFDQGRVVRVDEYFDTHSQVQIHT